MESSVLRTLVPHVTDLDIERALSEVDEDNEDEDASPLAQIAQRQLLYFGEWLVDLIIDAASYSWPG